MALGILAVVSDSIYSGLWSPSSSGSTDGLGIPAFVDAAADAVLWSPLRCGFDDAISVLDDVAAVVSTAGSMPKCANCKDSHCRPEKPQSNAHLQHQPSNSTWLA